MAIDKNLDVKKYQGRVGKVRRYMHQEYYSHNGRTTTMGQKLSDEFQSGVFWNPTGGDGGSVISGITAAGMILSTLVFGIGYMSANDAVDLSPETTISELAPLQDHTASAEATSYTILSRGEAETPYLLIERDDRVFVFEPQKENGFSSVRNGEELVDVDRWEWQLMSPQDGFGVISTFNGSLGIYEQAQDDVQAGFLSTVVPMTTYQASELSVIYSEHGGARITTGEVSVSPQAVNLDYINNLDETLEQFTQSMISGNYGYQEGQEPAYDSGDISESSLNGLSSAFFGKVVPFYFLMGFGFGANRVRKTIKNGPESKRKKVEGAKP